MLDRVITPQTNVNVVQSIGTGNNSTTTFSGTIANAPVIPGSVSVTNNAITITDNGEGAFTGAGATGTINYATGAVSVTFSVAPANGAVNVTSKVFPTSFIIQNSGGPNNFGILNDQAASGIVVRASDDQVNWYHVFAGLVVAGGYEVLGVLGNKYLDVRASNTCRLKGSIVNPT